MTVEAKKKDGKSDWDTIEAVLKITGGTIAKVVYKDGTERDAVSVKDLMR